MGIALPPDTGGSTFMAPRHLQASATPLKPKRNCRPRGAGAAPLVCSLPFKNRNSSIASTSLNLSNCAARSLTPTARIHPPRINIASQGESQMPPALLSMQNTWNLAKHHSLASWKICRSALLYGIVKFINRFGYQMQVFWAHKPIRKSNFSEFCLLIVFSLKIRYVI